MRKKLQKLIKIHLKKLLRQIIKSNLISLFYIFPTNFNSTDFLKYNNNYSISRLETTPEEKSEASSGDVKLRSGPRRTPSETSAAKRYTYSGPPAVSLGSWNERPSLNVQIKNDMDYKLGSSTGNGVATSGARTVVNLNGDVTEKTKKVEDDEPRVDTTSVSFFEIL